MRWVSLFVALHILILSDFVFSQDSVFVTLPHVTANENEFLNINVQVSNVTDLNVTSLQFTLLFSDSVLRAQGVAVGGTIMQDWGQPTVSISDSGTIKVGAFGLSPLKGSGRLINVLFQVVGHVADSSQLIMKPFTLNDGNPVAVSDTGMVYISQLVNVTVSTNFPAIVPVIVDGEQVSTPFKAEWDMFTEHSIGVIDSFTIDGHNIYPFIKWSDDGEKEHQVTIISERVFIAFFDHITAVSYTNEGIVREFNLCQNYPNPFNPTTTIRYTVSSATDVTVNIYNLKGQLVRNLFSGKVSDGFHDLVFDGKDDDGRIMASGIYFYELRSAEYRQVKKLIYIE